MTKVLYSALSVLVFTYHGTQAQPEIPWWQEQWNTIDDGGVITLPEGTFHLTQSLALREKKHVTIRGAGIGKTTLSFAGQTTVGAGVVIEACEAIVLRDLTIAGAHGTGILARDVHDLQFHHVEVKWAASRTENGAYGVHTLQCSRVLLFECRAAGASHAGLLIEECENIVVRKCHVMQNTAGIVLKNSRYANVLENTVADNTSGILILGTPLPEPRRTGHIKVYHNTISGNNRQNPASGHMTYSGISPGTGIALIAIGDITIHNNEIRNHRGPGISILSYNALVWDASISSFNPYPARIYIHDNTFDSNARRSLVPRRPVRLFNLVLRGRLPDILYDGDVPDFYTSPSTGRLLPEYEICIYDNGSGTFRNLDVTQRFGRRGDDPEMYRCR